MLQSVRTYLFILLFYLPLAAQSDSLFIKWAELMDEDPGLMENLQLLLEQPVNLNSATKEELLVIPFLAPDQADSIILRRENTGNFRTRRAIRKIVGEVYYELIKNLITVQKPKRQRNLVQNRSKLVIENLEQGRLSGYAGDAWSVYNKIYLQPSKGLRGGFITQKDAGERSYLDFITGYGEYAVRQWRLIAGSYYLHFGQGLVFSSPFGQRKSSAAMAPFVRLNEGGFATLSSSENTGNMGIYFKYTLPFKLNIHLFYANNKRDAQYDVSTGQISGIRYDGYHRTPPEILAKDRLEERLTGIGLSTEFTSRITFGMLWAKHRYSPAITPYLQGDDQSRRRGYFKFAGKEVNQFSLYYRAGLPSIRLEGEAAFSDLDKNQSAICQSLMAGEKNFSFGVKYWRLGKAYQSPSGRVFDDADPYPRGREGWYAAVFLKASEFLTMNLYRLLHKELWRGYFSNLPLQKREWLAELEFNWHDLSGQLRYRYADGEEILQPSDAPAMLDERVKKNWRIQAIYSVSGRTKIVTRWENVLLNMPGERGVNIFQEIQITALRKLRLNLRYSFFRTTSYDSRIYEYESDFPGAFANYAVYGEGSKWYLLLRYTPMSEFTVLLKYRYMSQSDLALAQANVFHQSLYLHRSVQFMLQWRF